MMTTTIPGITSVAPTGSANELARGILSSVLGGLTTHEYPREGRTKRVHADRRLSAYSESPVASRASSSS